MAWPKVSAPGPGGSRAGCTDGAVCGCVQGGRRGGHGAGRAGGGQAGDAGYSGAEGGGHAEVVRGGVAGAAIGAAAVQGRAEGLLDGAGRPFGPQTVGGAAGDGGPGPGRPFRDGVDLTVGRAEAAPVFRGGQDMLEDLPDVDPFDVILCSHVLEHPADPLTR